MKIVIINGRPCAGKDLFVKYCQTHCYWCLNISTVDFVKEVAAYCGWDGTKTPKNREFLSNLKDLLTKWNDVPYKKIKREIDLFKARMESHNFDSTKDGIVFIHCREPEEIAHFVKDMGAITLLMRRPEVEELEQSNHADAEVFNFAYNYTIMNDGTIEELDDKAVSFLEEIGVRYLK